MRLRPVPVFAATALSALLSVVSAGADSTPPGGAVATLDLAARLYAHALATDDAVAAVTAFRLAQSVTLRGEADWEKATEEATGDELVIRLPDGTVMDAGTPPPAPEGGTVAAAEPGASGVSALALVTGGMEAAVRELAAGDEELLALIDDAVAETARGRIGGANQQMAALAPGKKDVWEIAFAGMELAEIGVFSDGTGGLGWVVADAGGVPVCLDPYSEGTLYCAFTPRENAYYSVTVISRSETEAQYMLATN